MTESELCALAEKGQHTWQYKRVARIAKQLGWPQHWDTDLTKHDAALFAKYRPDTFVWCCRPCGTQLHWTNDENDLAWRRAEVKMWPATDQARYYVVDRSGASEITPATYASYMVQE